MGIPLAPPDLKQRTQKRSVTVVTEMETAILAYLEFSKKTEHIKTLSLFKRKTICSKLPNYLLGRFRNDFMF